MKIGIVGSGFVGATTAFALVMRGIGGEVVLVDLDEKRSRAEADDILHAVPFASPVDVIAGDYDDLAGARAVVVGAGVGQKPGETRIELLARNAAVFASVIPEILRVAPEAVLVIATNPVDVMTHLAAREAVRFGRPSTQVVGSGTMLDTARFRALTGRAVGIDARHVHAYVVGEHGDSEVLAWSTVRVGGVSLDEFTAQKGIVLGEAEKQSIDDSVRHAAYRIIEGKGATYYGVASALAAMLQVILNDGRALMTVCTPRARIAGVDDVTVSMPQILSGQGVTGDLHPLSLAAGEQERLEESARMIRSLLDDLERVRS